MKNESPRHCLALLGNPERKMFLAFRICTRLIFSEKGKDIFLWGSALQVFGQCGGASIRTRFCENYFLGERIWQNLGQLLFLNFVRAEEGSGEESARASEFFGERR